MAREPKMTTCRNCNTLIPAKARRCAACGAKNRKPFYKRGWFILLLILVIFGVYNTISRKIEEKEEKSSEYRWPNSELAGMIPQPDSPYGRISSESKNSFSIDIYKISEQQFEDYVDECKAYGFSVDYDKISGYYSADNEEGYSLMITYDDEEKEMGIFLYVPSDQEDTSKAESNSEIDSEEMDASGQPDDPNDEQTENTGSDESSEPEESGTQQEEEPSTDTEESQPSDEEKADELVDGMRPEFKEAMDSYEAFYDEYCEFLEEYSKNPTDVALLKKYTDFLSKTQEMEEKFEAWDDNEMNSAELKYYTEVHQRIMQKLLEVSTEG